MNDFALNNELYARITSLSDEGNEYIERQDYDSAISSFRQAYELLSEPKEKWEASGWLLVSIGDCLFHLGRYQEAGNYFNKVLKAEGELDNPFIWLRRGQCLYETGHQQEALDALVSAYMLGGREIYSEDDPKYFNFLKQYAAIEKE